MFGSDEARRTISLVGLIMLLLTVLEYVALGIVLKMEGYPSNQFVRWTSLAVTLCQHGHWFLAAPLIWTAYAVVSSHLDRGLRSESLALVIGIILVAVFLLLFLFAVARPFTRPLLFNLSTLAASAGSSR
jgi:hypothetical protein